MITRNILLVMASSMALCAGTSALAAAKKPAAAAARAPTPAAPVISPQIKTGLDRMGVALRALKAFEVKADITTEDVLETGQKLQSALTLTMDVQQPNRLYMDSDTPHKKRLIYYDGKDVTIYGPTTGYFASVSAPTTTREMLKAVRERYGFEMPLADLFQWGTSDFRIDRIKSALYAGSDRITGRMCDHYAFRQAGADWQLWINQVDALPCKLVLVNTDDSSQPQTSAVYDWNINPQFTEAQFTFAPPEKARRIVMGQVNPTSGTGATK